MDLYSIARRLTSPFVFSDGTPEKDSIGARGLIGDGQTAALVGADGSIDWLCLPRFDSPSVFARVLDQDKGGTCRVGPSMSHYESLQQYDPDTNVLETLFSVHGQGVLRVIDFMPWSDDPRASVSEVHRRVECVEGSVDVTVRFDPRFDYGRSQATFERGTHGVVAVGDAGERLGAVLGLGEPWSSSPDGGLVSKFTLQRGERTWLVLSWDTPVPEPLSAYRPFHQLRATRAFWRNWTRTLTYQGPYRHHVVRSALLLKLLIYAPTGAMVAAPTTSLPEWIGGVRNWDYRYSWTRDSAMAIQAASRVGCVNEARDFFHFVRDILDGDRDLQIMYCVDGTPVPKEQELTHLSGFHGSSPVRIGNGARDQVQLDTAGALLSAAHLYELGSGGLTLRVWRRLRDVVEEVSRLWSEPDHGIWEPRDGVRHNVHSKLLSWVALDRGAELAALFGDDDASARFRADARLVKDDVFQRGLSADGRHFVSSYGGEDPDASLLLLSTLEFVDAKDPRMEATIDWVRERLGAGAFLHRYRVDDGVGGEEGAFVLCGFWLAEALARSGRLSEAQDVFVAHAEASNHLGLLAEEVDPATGALLGNFPQAFSHLGLINAAIRIDDELRKKDEGGSAIS